MEEAEQGKAGLEKVIVEVGEKVELGKTVSERRERIQGCSQWPPPEGSVVAPME